MEDIPKEDYRHTDIGGVETLLTLLEIAHIKGTHTLESSYLAQDLERGASIVEEVVAKLWR